MSGPEKDEVVETKCACARLHVERTTSEHKACPYCFGKRQDIERGDRSEFCDFQPGVDPVSFGFPENTSRSRG